MAVAASPLGPGRYLVDFWKIQDAATFKNEFWGTADLNVTSPFGGDWARNANKFPATRSLPGKETNSDITNVTTDVALNGTVTADIPSTRTSGWEIGLQCVLGRGNGAGGFDIVNEFPLEWIRVEDGGYVTCHVPATEAGTFHLGVAYTSRRRRSPSRLSRGGRLSKCA